MQAIFNPHSFKQIKSYLKEVPIVIEPIVEQIVEPIVETIVEPIVESIVEQIVEPIIVTEETKSSLYNDN